MIANSMTVLGVEHSKGGKAGEAGELCSAIAAARIAWLAGLQIRVVDGDLSLSAPSEPPASLLNALSKHKAAIIALLLPSPDGWNAEDWHLYYEERAAISEYDSSLPRPQAEALAFACCVTEWLNRNPVRSSSDLCLACRAVARPHDPLLPFGVESQGLAWLHHQCWRVWQENRRGQAVVALAKMGIEEPGKPAGRQP